MLNSQPIMGFTGHANFARLTLPEAGTTILSEPSTERYIHQTLWLQTLQLMDLANL